MTPDWIRHAVWWQVYPLGATGAEREALPDGARRRAAAAPAARRGCRTWSSLGCNGLALGPVFESATHGYDTVDHLRVDRRLGTEQDLTRPDRRLPRDAASGCSSTASSTTSAAASRSSARCWSRGRRAGGRLVPTSTPTATGPDGFGYRDFEGHSAAGRPQPRQPGGRRPRRRGDDALVRPRRRRLAAGRRLRRPAGLLARGAAAGARARIPTCGSSARCCTATTPATSRSRALDSVTQYELWKAIWSSLNDRNLFELAHALQPAQRDGRHVPAADVRRQPRRHPAGQPARRRPAPAAGARAAVRAARRADASTTATSSGCAGVKEDRAGGDDAVRPPLPASDAPPEPGGRRGRRSAPAADRGAPAAPVAGRRDRRGAGRAEQRGARGPAHRGGGRAGRRPQRRGRPRRRRPSVSRAARGGRPGESRPAGGATAVQVPPHEFALVGDGG